MYQLEEKHFWFLGKRLFVNSILHSYSKKIKNILDIGAGTGGITKYMAKFGKVTGIESNRLARALANKRGVKLLSGNANKLSFKSSQFDTVTIFDVLYHKNIKDEGRVIKEAYRVLKPNGLLLITDSANKILTSAHDTATHGKRRYSVNEISHIIRSQNFKIIRSSYIFATLFPIVFVKRMFLDKITSSKSSDVSALPKIINSFILRLLKIEVWFFEHFDLPFGTSVIVLAQKIP